MTEFDNFQEQLRSVREQVHSALSKLAEQRSPQPSHWQVVEQVFGRAGEVLGLAIREVASVRDIQGQAKAAGLTVEYSDRSGFEGDLLPSGAALLIRIPKWQPLARARATLAHEFGHSFFWTKHRGRMRRLINYLGDQFSAKQEERVCWRFARSYLMPATLLRGWVSLSPQPSADAVRAIAESNAISLDVLLIRFKDEALLSGSVFATAYHASEDTYRTTCYIGEAAGLYLRSLGIDQPTAYIKKLSGHQNGIELVRQFLAMHRFSVSVVVEPRHGLLAAFVPSTSRDPDEL